VEVQPLNRLCDRILECAGCAGLSRVADEHVEDAPIGAEAVDEEVRHDAPAAPPPGR
jgi:hypothetical protein